MTKPLLIEIGVEELPAIPFLKQLLDIEQKWQNILEQNSLLCSFEFFYTPRRLVLWHNEFLISQKEKTEEFYGAPEHIAYKNNIPTNAAISFAKKCEVDVEDLQLVEKDGKKVLFCKKIIKAKHSHELLGQMIEKFVKSLNFGKSMRWGSLKESFIRPIRWVGCMFDDELVSFEMFGVKSNNFSYGHRNFGQFEYKNCKQYFENIKKYGVNLFQDERKQNILNQIHNLEKKYNFSVQKDEELLSEVVTITEHPTAIVGSFDEHFLSLPPEVIITSMKEHQRYFPCFDKNGNLINNFVVISNAYSDDTKLVRMGNEKVLRARLSDALFFWDNDIKNGLDTQGLKDIMFLNSLGTLYDKTQKEQKIGQYLAKKYLHVLKNEQNSLSEDEILNLIDRSIYLSKADLLTQMVYEFTELQGLMGYYYAKAANEDERVCISIKEQYLPLNSIMPSSIFSSIVCLSSKIDSLLALFSIDKIPSGTKDPFALRRAVNAIVKIVIHYELEFDINEDFKALKKQYHDFDIEKLQEFFIERLYGYFDVNASIINAVLLSGEKNILKISQKIEALDNIVKASNAKDSFSTFKRLANIIKDVSTNLHVDKTLLIQNEEKSLYDSFLSVKDKKYNSYEEKLDALFALKDKIDEFFDNVMVNASEQNIKQNRQGLLFEIYSEFKSIADIKEVSI